MIERLTRRVTKHIPISERSTTVTYNGERTEIQYEPAALNKYWNLVENGTVTQENVPIDLLDHNKDYSIDVGAHVGCYTVLLSILNPASDVIAFEPDDENRAVLRNIIEVNGLDPTIRSEVVTDETGEVSFYVSETYSESHTTTETGGFTEVTKPSVALSDVLDGVDSAFLKIDAEGGEKAIADDIGSIEGVDLSGLIELHPDKLDSPANTVLSTLRRRFDTVRFVSESSPNHPAEQTINHPYNRPMYYFE